ncbi:hypothetical protein [Desertivirga brevis]|uniref:hypothetical protein n=1 Tax=Desertivirga brevis TaxID=2810310 RepID=UPI001A971A67|nr:hypothetical protein [Pedobacter sp. SYSU D00873]
MKLRFDLTKAFAVVAMASTIAIYSACTPDDAGDGNGLDSPDLVADFTITPVANRANYYVLKANTDGVISVKWNLGKGASDPAAGKTVDTVFYPDAGTYTITQIAVGKGGVQKSTTKQLNVPTSDPEAGNLILDPKMDDPTKWTVTRRGTNANVQFAGGKAVFTGSAFDGVAISQPVQLVAGKKYKIDMTVSGGGAVDTWMEVYLGKGVPANGADYNEGGKIMGLSTWDGCGNSTFNGQLAQIGCTGDRRNGVVTVNSSGTYYLVIRSGSGSTMGPNGISLDNIELRGTK